jgi:NADPH:quinone reductase-like Zn-dependent oxidoreductase
MRIKRILKWSTGLIALLVVSTFAVAWFTSDNSCSDPATTAPKQPMKAVIACEYGGPEVLRLTDVEKPVPGDSQVLVRVHAASVNALDWHGMRGAPYIARPIMGLRKPKDVRMGVDFAGTVEAVGKSVTRFRPGDQVFGGSTGAFGEYVTVGESRGIALKPASLTFEQAAAIPVAGVTALQSARDQAKLGPGQTVLINGASGGVGTFTVQIARALGAEVTAVSSTRNVELVRSLGAQHVVDYTKQDFAQRPERYDVVIDNVANRKLADFKRVLKPGGRYVLVGGGSGRWLDPFPRIIGMKLQSPFVKPDMRFFIARLDHDDLALLADWVVAGKIRPIIDRTYPMSQIAAAVGYVDQGHARAKVVVKIQ